MVSFNMKNYIIESSAMAQQNSKERFIYGDKLVLLKDQLPDGFDLQSVLGDVEELVPKSLIRNVDAIYVGDFSAFNSDGLPFNAKYKDGALYVTNDQQNEEDMVDDIVHEMAHAVEETYGKEIYFDDSLKSEFLAKRKALYQLLDQEGFEPSKDMFNDIEYNKKMDYYLYNVVGYPTLQTLAMGLFYSPYAITSINEYFANGFENYFVRDRLYLKDISPTLYKKINDILENVEINHTQKGYKNEY